MDGTHSSAARATSADESPSGGPRSYDIPDGESPSRTVVASVADALDADPLSLPPLYDAIDLDALDAFLDSIEGSDHRLTFSYAGVSVEFDGASRLWINRA